MLPPPLPSAGHRAGPIVVIDDDADIREIVREILELHGYEAAVFAGGVEALEYLRAAERRPGLILLDLMMPGMSGWDFREAQLREPSLASIPVVVVTASRNLDRAPIAADRVVLKPIGMEELVSVVAQCAA